MDELLRRLHDALERGHVARPDVEKEDLMVPVTFGAPLPPGVAAGQSIDEFNATSEVMAFVCCRVAEGPSAVNGSGVKVCETCKLDVWMSPATQGMFDRILNRRIVCTRCVVKEKIE